MGVHASPARLRRELAAVAPMPSPAKKRPISDFFQPYLKSNVPTKRPSPSSDPGPGKKSLPKDGFSVATPRPARTLNNVQDQTPPAPVFSPSTPGSRSSLPIRSPHPKPGVPPASTYKQAPQFTSTKAPDVAPVGFSRSFNFADVPRSTQAVVKGDKVIEIRDSDDDTDSLVSLEDILGRRKTEPETSRSSSPVVNEDALEAERVQTLSLFTHGRSDPLVGKNKLRALYAQQNAQKFDIRRLLGDHFDDRETEEKVQKARDNYEESTRPRVQDRDWVRDRELLATVAVTEDGDEGVSRLLDAVQRQEAFNLDRTFSFFGNTGVRDWTTKAPPMNEFPAGGIPCDVFLEQDQASRSRSFLSGYIGELAAQGRLGNQTLRWVFQNVILEPEDDLRQTYIDCMSRASVSWARTNISASDVQAIFQILGADATSLQDTAAIVPRHYVARETGKSDPKYLLAALEVLELMSEDMDFAALSKLTSIVCQLAVDQQLMGDGRIAAKVAGLLGTLLSSADCDIRSHVADRLIQVAGQHLKSPSLQAQLLSHILPGSIAACQIRIRLARTFLLGADGLHQNESVPFQIDLKALRVHITTSPFFDTSRHKSSDPLDYVSLRFLSHILDVAVSDGGRPSSFSSRSEETTFNKIVDQLADAVKAIFISIVDTGASHMSRTEAKDVLQALHWRLLYTVRSEPRPKKNIFDPKTGKSRDGEEVRAEQKGRELLKNFLARKKDREQKSKDDNQSRYAADNIQQVEAVRASNNESAASSSDSNGGADTAVFTSLDRPQNEKAATEQLGLS